MSNPFPVAPRGVSLKKREKIEVWTKILSFPLNGITVGLGGSLAFTSSVVWLLLPLLTLLILMGLVKGTESAVKSARAWEKPDDLRNNSWELRNLATSLQQLPEDRRETYRELWTACLELDSSPTRHGKDYAEIEKFINAARSTVQDAVRAQAELDALVTAHPAEAIRVVPEAFRISPEALKALESAQENARVLREVTEELRSTITAVDA